MPFLSPAKLLVILVVALVVLGPEKLPKVARQIGGLWGEFRKLRERLEGQVRGTFPDLPSSETITKAVRSPISFLDTLADSHAAETGTTSSAAAHGTGEVVGEAVRPSASSNRPAGTVHAGEPPPAPTGDAADGVVHQVRLSGRELPDDPGLN